MAQRELALAPEADETPEESSRGMDPEIRLIGKFVREIERLDDSSARGRVIDYLYSRFGAMHG